MTPEEFKQHRKSLGLTQRELAAKLGLAKNGGRTIRRIEAGENASGILIKCFRFLIKSEKDRKIDKNVPNLG